MSHHARRLPGFSLVELLVVIAIIAIVIAIIVPALNGARTAARKTATQNLLSNVTAAAMQFSQDNSGSMPGYFSPTDMGGVANMDSRKGGFTMMENVLLDLIGQDAIVGTAGLSGSGQQSNGKTIGPFGNAGAKGQSDKSNIKVDLDLLSTGEHVYLSAGAANLAPASGQAASTPHQEFPDLIDAFGNPVMAWVEDRTAPREPADNTDFAGKDSKTKRARFYYAENFGYLTSTGLGRGGKDQTFDPTGARNGSLLNDASVASKALSAALGSPNFPLPMDFKDSDVHPGAPRGAFIVHSAGADGVYLGQRDSGARALGVGNASDPLEYKYNFFAGSKRLTDSSGKVASIDLVQGFDDIIQAAGN